MERMQQQQQQRRLRRLLQRSVEKAVHETASNGRNHSPLLMGKKKKITDNCLSCWD